MMNNFPRGAVVVGVDGSPDSDNALSAAVEQARLEHRPLHILHSYDLSPVYFQVLPDRADRAAHIKQVAQDIADRALARATETAPGLDVTVGLGASDPREALLKASETASIVVVGSRGLGTMRSLLLGSVSAWISTHAHSPTLVVRPSDAERRARIMVGTDATKVSSAAMEFAFAHASLRGAPLTVVHCFDKAEPSSEGDPEERLALAESMAGLRDKYVDVQVEVEFGRGSAAAYLSQASERADILVVGSRFRSTAAAMLFGAVSRAVVEHAACSVAVVPNHPE